MKKKWYAISALFLGMTVAVADSGMPEWNGKNSFYSWKKQANVKVDVTPEALVLTEIKADPQVISGILAIDLPNTTLSNSVTVPPVPEKAADSSFTPAPPDASVSVICGASPNLPTTDSGIP